MKKYKLSFIQHCPIHNCDITASRIDELTGNMIFNCKNKIDCIWIKNYEHELRHKYSTIIAIQILINKIFASYPNSKKRNDILASTMRLADYI